MVKTIVSTPCAVDQIKPTSQKLFLHALQPKTKSFRNQSSSRPEWATKFAAVTWMLASLVLTSTTGHETRFTGSGHGSPRPKFWAHAGRRSANKRPKVHEEIYFRVSIGFDFCF